MRLALVAFTAMCLIGASDSADLPRTPAAQAKLDRYLGGRVAGEPRKCLPTNRVTHPIPIDENIIVFRDGPHLWLNRVQASFECGELSERSSVAFESHLGNICSGDTLLFSNNGVNGGCALGEFVPYDKAR